ncbi:G protein-coupled glucose receptor regulating Gpa2-domain-containing protein [Echria macrotheca]|uniref:G protein-coupled glucose receptor regulating Gpa2-domain-containing protein n=1 Tax=Echria macrotheca TaxID=438768 RepID=A0AAJ0B3E6_9PEZI|nr:G protein-coupled glucose receptor regulating Gpa2-domain-containing protein [Echria macrotheca]
MANDNPLLTSLTGSLDPLPEFHRQGLAAVATLAGLSIISSTVVLLYLGIKLTRWHIRKRREEKLGNGDNASDRPFDGRGFHNPPRAERRKANAHPNQFLILLLNLLLADIHQAGAFLLNAVWVGRNAIDVGTSTCFAQGWLVSTGDLASSCFITAIAVHTYLTVVWNYKPPQWALYTTVVGLWIFDYFLAILGPAITSNGRVYGGFYVRASAWCWISHDYETFRLVLHYLFIFISLALTSILYLLIFLHIRKTPSSPPPRPPQPPLSTDSDSTKALPPPPPAQKDNHHRAFLMYPVIYVVCTAPLAIGRIVSMAGVNVPIAYFCLAGALITSNGWLDVLLWGLTRRVLLFESEVDVEDVGLDTFVFMRTPQGRLFGNIVWVEGAAGGGNRGHGGGGGKNGNKTASQESLRDHGLGTRQGATEGIQLDLVTSVVPRPDTARSDPRMKLHITPGQGPAPLGSAPVEFIEGRPMLRHKMCPELVRLSPLLHRNEPQKSGARRWRMSRRFVLTLGAEFTPPSFF